jgi:hypothetical protein
LAVATSALAVLLAGCERGGAEALAAPPAAAPGTFTKVYVVSHTDKVVMYVDAATVTRSGQTATVWLLSAHAPDAEVVAGATFVEARNRFDCESNTRTLLELRGVRKDGSTLVNIAYDNEPPTSFNPKGVFGWAISSLCKPGVLEKHPVVRDYRHDGWQRLKLD